MSAGLLKSCELKKNLEDVNKNVYFNKWGIDLNWWDTYSVLLFKKNT